MTIPKELYPGQSSTSTSTTSLTLEQIQSVLKEIGEKLHDNFLFLADPETAKLAGNSGVKILSVPQLPGGKVYQFKNMSPVELDWLIPFSPPDSYLANPFLYRTHVSPSLSHLLKCDGGGESHPKTRRSKNQAGIWWSWSRRRKRKVFYRQNRHPIRGPQFRTTPYYRSCLDNHGEYRG